MNKDKAGNNHVGVTIDNKKGAVTSNLNPNSNGNQIFSTKGNHSNTTAASRNISVLNNNNVPNIPDNNIQRLLLQHHQGILFPDATNCDMHACWYILNVGEQRSKEQKFETYSLFVLCLNLFWYI